MKDMKSAFTFTNTEESIAFYTLGIFWKNFSAKNLFFHFSIKRTRIPTISKPTKNKNPQGVNGVTSPINPNITKNTPINFLTFGFEKNFLKNFIIIFILYTRGMF